MKKNSKRPIGESLTFYSRYLNESNELWDSKDWDDSEIQMFVENSGLDILSVRRLIFQFEHTQKSINKDLSEISDEFKRLIDDGGPWSRCSNKPKLSPLKNQKERRTIYLFDQATPKTAPIQFGHSADESDRFRLISWIWVRNPSTAQTLALLVKNAAKVSQLEVKGWTEKDGVALSSISFSGKSDDVVGTVEDAAERLVAPFRQIPEKAWDVLLQAGGMGKGISPGVTL